MHECPSNHLSLEDVPLHFCLVFTGGTGAAGDSCGTGGPSATFIYVLNTNVYMTGTRLSNPIPKKAVTN